MSLDSAENVKAIDTCDSKSYVGDFNGDGLADIFCRHSDGKVSLSRMNTKGAFDGTEPMEWDWCDKEDELHAGRINTTYTPHHFIVLFFFDILSSLNTISGHRYLEVE